MEHLPVSTTGCNEGWKYHHLLTDTRYNTIKLTDCHCQTTCLIGQMAPLNAAKDIMLAHQRIVEILITYFIVNVLYPRTLGGSGGCQMHLGEAQIVVSFR